MHINNREIQLLLYLMEITVKVFLLFLKRKKKNRQLAPKTNKQKISNVFPMTNIDNF